MAIKNETNAPDTGKTIPPPDAPEAEPRILTSELAAAITTGELDTALQFNKRFPEAIKKPIPALVYPAFNSVASNHTTRNLGVLAQPGQRTLIEFLAIAIPPATMSTADKAEMLDLEKKIRGLWSQFDDCSLQKANADYMAQHQALEQLDADGKLPATQTQSREDLKAEYLSRQRAIHANLDPLIARARQLAIAHARTIYCALTREAAAMEIGERDHSELYDCLFVPSYTLRCAWTLMIRFINPPNINGEVFPTTMLKIVGVEI